jgi:hypothetical protein
VIRTGHRGPVWATWWGGQSYAVPYIEEAELFDSVQATRAEMWRRYFNRDGSTPCVDGDEMHVYYADPRESSDPYPDLVLSRGPRGGIKMERV